MELGLQNITEQQPGQETELSFGIEPSAVEEALADLRITLLDEMTQRAIDLLRSVGATKEVMAMIDPNNILAENFGIDVENEKEAGEAIAAKLEETLQEADTEGLLNNIGAFFEKGSDKATIKSWKVGVKEMLEECDELLDGEVYSSVKNIDPKRLKEIPLHGMHFDAYMKRLKVIVQVLDMLVTQVSELKFDLPAVVKALKPAGMEFEPDTPALYTLIAGDYTFIRETTAEKLGLTPARMIEMLKMAKENLARADDILDKVNDLRNNKRELFDEKTVKGEEKKKLKKDTRALKFAIFVLFGKLWKHARAITGLASSIEDKIRK